MTLLFDSKRRWCIVGKKKKKRSDLNDVNEKQRQLWSLGGEESDNRPPVMKCWGRWMLGAPVISCLQTSKRRENDAGEQFLMHLCLRLLCVRSEDRRWRLGDSYMDGKRHKLCGYLFKECKIQTEYDSRTLSAILWQSVQFGDFHIFAQYGKRILFKYSWRCCSVIWFYPLI